MSKAPRAIRLGQPGDEIDAAVSSGRDVSVLPESEPIEDAPQESVRPAKRFSWGTVFVSALGAFLALSASVWAERTISDLMLRNPALGYAALACATVALAALFVMLGRVLRDILRERKVEHLRVAASEVLVSGDTDAAKTLAGELTKLYATRPQTAAGRAALTEALPDLFAARDVLTVAERSLMGPLDALAQAQIAQAARRVSLVTAVSPRAAIDIVFVLVACARLLRTIAGIYAGRPGTLGLIRLGRQVLGHLVVTGGIAAGDEVIQQVVGQGLAARLSAKLGEGVLNGLLTARIGLAALAVCRPLPFVEAEPPKLSDVVGDFASWRGSES